jgi:uncharacterized membrane protein YfcA
MVRLVGPDAVPVYRRSVGDPKLLVLAPLVAVGALFAGNWLLALKSTDRALRRPTALQTSIGFAANFLDTLGIGSFATTTSVWRPLGVVADRLIPGTLNVGHALPTVAQALIYVAIIEVDAKTLFLMIAAAVLGAGVGSGIVARWPERKVRIAMGLALVGAAALMLARLLGFLPAGGEATGLSGAFLWVGVGGNFVLGALMTAGIGLYAPCMILVSLLGMSPKASFPIMMGSCAFLMPVASLRFVRMDGYSPRAAIGLTLGGVPAVLIAAYLVRELPLDLVRWLVIAAVAYTAGSLLRAAARS